MSQSTPRFGVPELFSSSNSWHRAAFGALVGFTFFSWLCFVAFIERPQNLQLMEFFPLIFGIAFKVFAQLHVVLCFAVLFGLIARRGQWAWLKSFAAVFLISLSAEMGGTTIGFPFGHYQYTELLGLKLFDHVPVLIPVSWFVVSACGHMAAAHLFPESSASHRVRRVILTSLSLVLWDLSLDPAMSHRFNYWTWYTTGDYFYGMPMINVLGWFGTGLAIGGAFELFRFRFVVPRAVLRTWVAHYALFVSLSIGFVALAGYWTSLAATVIGYGGLFLALRRFAPRRESRVSAASGAVAPA